MCFVGGNGNACVGLAWTGVVSSGRALRKTRMVRASGPNLPELAQLFWWL